MAPHPTPKRELADLLIPGGLEAFVESRRPTSWQRIATEVYLATKGRVELSDETLRTWFPQFAAPCVPASVAGAPEDAA